MTRSVAGSGGGYVSARPSMTGGGAALKAGGPSNFAAGREPAAQARLLFGRRQNRFLHRRCAAPSVALTATPPPVSLTLFSMVRTDFEEADMAQIMNLNAANDGFEALVLGLELEFGHGDVGNVAAQFIDAEAADFYWNARMSERHLGAYESFDGDDFDLERIAVIGVLVGSWFVATCIVNGDGAVHFMTK